MSFYEPASHEVVTPSPAWAEYLCRAYRVNHSIADAAERLGVHPEEATQALAGLGAALRDTHAIVALDRHLDPATIRCATMGGWPGWCVALAWTHQGELLAMELVRSTRDAAMHVLQAHLARCWPSVKVLEGDPDEERWSGWLIDELLAEHQSALGLFAALWTRALLTGAMGLPCSRAQTIQIALGVEPLPAADPPPEAAPPPEDAPKLAAAYRANRPARKHRHHDTSPVPPMLRREMENYVFRRLRDGVKQYRACEEIAVPETTMRTWIKERLRGWRDYATPVQSLHLHVGDGQVAFCSVSLHSHKLYQITRIVAQIGGE